LVATAGLEPATPSL